MSSTLFPILVALFQVPVPGEWDPAIPSPCLPYDPQNSIEWPDDPSYGTPAGFGRVVVGDLDGDQLADGIVLADGIPVVLWGLAVQDAPVRIEFALAVAPSDVGDVAVLAGGGPEGRDALVLSDARGLYLVTYDQGAFAEPVLLAGTALAHARPIHVDHVDGDGTLDVLALASDRYTVYVSLQQGSGFVTTQAAVLPYQAFDVVAVNWNQQGARELVAVTTRGLVAHSLNGVLLGGAVHLAPWGRIERLETSSVPGGEILAWVRPTPGGPSQLLLRSASTSEGPWTLTLDVCGTSTDVHPSAILGGLYDADANEDLLLARADGPAIVLVNLGAEGGPHFAPQDPDAYDVLALSDSPVVTGPGLPAFAEVDGAGAHDFVFAVAGSERVEVFLHYPYVRALQGGQVDSADVYLEETEFGPEVGLNRLRVAFEIPPPYAQHTHLELKVWRQPLPAGPVESQALAYARYELATSGGTTHPLRQWLRVEPAFPDFQYAPDPCWAAPRPSFYLQLRFARQLASGAWSRSPAFVGGFTLEHCDGMTGYDELAQLALPGSQPFPLYADNGLLALPLDRNQLGLFVEMSSVPPFPEGETPTVPSLLTGFFAYPFGNE